MIAQKVSFAFFNQLVISGLGYISLFFVAHYMGPKAVGIIAFALAYIGLFQDFSDLGFGSAHIKRVSEGKDLGKCNGTYFTVKVLLTAIMAIIILSTIFISKFIQHKSFISREHEIVLYLILLSTVIGNFSMMFIITFSARKEIAKQNIPLLIGKIIQVIGKVIVAITGLGVILLAGVSLISATITLLCFLYLFRDYPIKKPDKEYFKSYVTFAIPVMFIGFLSGIAQNLDKVMIQFFWTTSDVGYYSAAQRVSLILTFITLASNALIFPTISSYHSREDIEGIRILSNKAERYLSMIFFPAVVFIFVFSHPLCRMLLGVKFVSSAPILIILSLVALVDGTTQPYTQQTGGTNHIILAAKLSSVVFILNILLNFLFIPSKFLGVKLLGMGGTGAALATLISVTIGSFLFRFYAYKITFSKPNPRILFHLVSALLMGIALHFISSSISTILWYYLPVFAFIGITIYVFILTVFQEFTLKDLNLFLSTLNPVQIKNYAIGEIKSGYIKNK